MMRVFRAAVVSMVFVVVGVLPAFGAAAANPAAGAFQANINFVTVQLKDVPPSSCLLTVDGVLTFTGTLVGTAAGMTNALETAPCSAVSVNPPGTFSDAFQFRGHFVGTVNERHIDTSLTYSGVTYVGGHIDAIISLLGSGIGPLRATATVAVGGTYIG
jgi:hypothetical protein